MGDVKSHYAELLGPIYTWYTSAAGDPVGRARAWLERHELASYQTYLDLGAGSGAHTLALLAQGKHVTAVDFDTALVAELRSAAAEHAARLTLHEDELVKIVRDARTEIWDVILCAGDTLTHLPSVADIAELMRESARHLAKGGRFALQYRDSTGFSAQGVARFLEVARDSRRTLHCLLEPLDAEHLRVTDIVTEVTTDGPRTRLSDYVKLRLTPERLVGLAEPAGLSLDHQVVEAGMTTLCFRAR
jgi:SAM-dependent methyltransferase